MRTKEQLSTGATADVLSNYVSCMGMKNPDRNKKPVVSFTLPVCTSQTFMLEFETHNADGTMRIVESIPCSAGSSDDVCIVEVSVSALEIARS